MASTASRSASLPLVLLALCIFAGAAKTVSDKTASGLRAGGLQQVFKHKSILKASASHKVKLADDDDGKSEDEAESDDEGDSDDESDDSGDEGDDSSAETKEAQAELEAVQEKRKKANQELARFKNSKEFKSKVEDEEVVVARETQSQGLANFLAEMRKEVHTYATPAYTDHLAEKEAKLEKEEKALEKKLGALEGNGDSSDESEKSKKDADADTKAEQEEAEIKTLQKQLASGNSEAGHVFALAFLGTVIMLSVTFAMANSNTKDGTVRNYTWFLIDTVTAVFLAVMYFQAFDDLLDFLEIGGGYKILTSVIHAVVMLSMALFLAFYLRKHEVGLAILCGAGAHVVSFTSIHAAATVQNNHWLAVGYHWVFCLIGMVVLGLVLALIGYAITRGKNAAGVDEDDGFMDKTDDLENDFGAMAFSVCWSMFVRFLLTGHHPTDDDTEFDHSATQRNMMLAYAFGALALGGVIVYYCGKVRESTTSYPKKRLANFVSTVAAMNVAWGFFYWAEWELFETVFKGQPIFGRIAFALTSTCAGFLGIVVLANFGKNLPSSMTKVSLTALALIVAWSWELCFDAAIDDMCEGESHPAMWKIGSAVLMFAVVIPVYGIYMKPITTPAAEAIGA